MINVNDIAMLMVIQPNGRPKARYALITKITDPTLQSSQTASMRTLDATVLDAAGKAVSQDYDDIQMIFPGIPAPPGSVWWVPFAAAP